MTEPLLNVLIVDDEPTYRLVLTQTLKGCGHTTEACETGDDAISLLQKNKYDVVLLDYKMPGTSGINVLQWMYGMKMDVPVIIITGYGSEGSEQAARQLGAIEYIEKSWNIESMIDRISTAVRKLSGVEKGEEKPGKEK